jgi:hypothetical protein
MIAWRNHPVEAIQPWDIPVRNEIRLVLVEIKVNVYVSIELYAFYLKVQLPPSLADPTVVLVLEPLELIHDLILIIALDMANDVFLEVLIPDCAGV